MVYILLYYYIVLYYILLYYIILYCLIILYCVLLYYILLYCIVLYCIVLIVLYYIVLYYIYEIIHLHGIFIDLKSSMIYYNNILITIIALIYLLHNGITNYVNGKSFISINKFYGIFISIM